MISDVLHDAMVGIVRWLEQAPDVYTGDLRERIERLVVQMDAMRKELDTPPASADPVH